MQIAYFDCVFGAAGNMLLGALLGAGLPEAEWKAELSKIALPQNGFTLTIEDVVRCTIASKLLTVEESVHHKHYERHLTEILEIISRSVIAQEAKDLASQIFIKLGEAEAKVHGVPVAQIHFHELGAIDAIVDIVGFAVGYHMLGIDESYCSLLPLGSGTVKTRHGLFPVPGPAVALLLSEAQVPTVKTDIAYECLTPTAAAILTTITRSWGGPPAMTINNIGYGAGNRDPVVFPNVLRLLLGKSQTMQGTESGGDKTTNLQKELVFILEANLDDFTPQALSYATERLFEAGALDVAVLPAVMKKGRSGHLLSVISPPERKEILEELILRETSTLGVRSHMCERRISDREWKEVMLSAGSKVRIKLARDRLGAIINAQPEYDDCASYAISYGVPLKEVFAEALGRLYLDNGF